MAKVNVQIVKGMVTGFSVYLNGMRIAGQKPWGGGITVAEYSVEEKHITDALKNKPRGSERLKKALDALKPIPKGGRS